MTKEKTTQAGGESGLADSSQPQDGGFAPQDSDKTVFQTDPSQVSDKTVLPSVDDNSTRMQYFAPPNSEAQDPTIPPGSNPPTPDAPAVSSDKTQILYPPSEGGSDRTMIMGGSINETQLLADVESRTQLMGENVTVAQSMGSGSIDTGQVDVDGKTVIKDRFVLESLLGSGGMGAVYKAKDLRKVEAKDRDPWVAVKVLNESFKNHPSAFISLQREARKSQTLAHANIVQVFDFDRDGDMVFMTMELLSGASMEDVIQQNPEGLDLAQVLFLSRQMGDALSHAHKHRITHADFKPGNVFLTEKGNAKVIDFGIARAVSSVESDTKDDKTIFDPNSLGALTPAYASLEMLLGEEPLPSDDVYALGCIIYEMLTGRHPFAKRPADQVAIAKLKPKRIKMLSRRQWRALQRSLALKRVNRFATADDFLDQFAPIVNPWKRPVAMAAGLVLMLAAFGAYRGYESSLKEQKLEQEKQVLAERQALQDQENQIQKQVQEVAVSLEQDYQSLSSKASDLQGILDQRNLNFDTGTLWRRQTKLTMSELLAVYRADQKLVAAKSHDLAGRADFQTMLGDEARKRQQAKQTLANWARNYNYKLSDAYLAGAVDASNSENFTVARKLATTAGELNSDSAQLLNVNKQIEQQYEAYQRRLAEQEAARQAAQLAAERQRLQGAFDAEMAALESTVASCQSGLLREGRGGSFNLDLGLLSSEFNSAKRRYPQFSDKISSVESQQMRRIQSCLQVYGYGKTEDAKSRAKQAAALFPAFAQEYEALSIYPWNSCKSSFAGRGQRYSCRDRFLSQAEGRGPELVVIPESTDFVPFAISKFEITESEFDQFCESSGLCAAGARPANSPVTGRSIALYEAYAAWMSDTTGFSYSLPSLEQWQYAAAAQNSALDSGRNCTLKARGIQKGDILLPVDMGAGNRWGMVNHVGNAQELVSSSAGWRAAGAAHSHAMEDCVLERLDTVPDTGDAITGFRVVKALPQAQNSLKVNSSLGGNSKSQAQWLDKAPK